MYLDGHILKQDYAEAMKGACSRRARASRRRSKISPACIMTAPGSGRIIGSAKWMRLAASRETPKSQFNLGTMYVAGQGLDRDLLRVTCGPRSARTFVHAARPEKEMQELSAQLLSEPDLAKAKEMVKSARNRNSRIAIGR